ncbi:MAG: class I SAM-dependent methyltransferase [Pirellulales bacterium]|nr:class I SAM-dependent methyltransferase [Pirellulales bacterium]
MARTLQQKIRREFRRFFQPKDMPTIGGATFDDGWGEERIYWFNVLRDFYSAYGLEPHPIQSDASLVPPLERVASIQRPDKAHPDVFFASGYRGALGYLTELRDYGASVEKMQNILEMGVGMGRLMAQLFPLPAKLYGCDVTPAAVNWTKSKLGHRVDVELTNLEPPLPYTDSMFDFVYANSVFTHVPCSLMTRWADELHRIVRPGGFLIFSVFDANHYLRDMPYREFHGRFTAAGCHDWNHDRGVHMMTYLSRDYIHATWGPYFRVLELRSHYRDQTHVICRRGA